MKLNIVANSGLLYYNLRRKMYGEERKTDSKDEAGTTFVYL